MLVIVRDLAYAQAALEVGADEFLVMPVDPIEAVLRVRKLARTSDLIRVGELEIDLAAWRVNHSGRRVRLSPVEFRLLACLAKRVGQMVSHAAILDEVWGWEAEYGALAQVQNYIGRLRRKIEPDAHPHSAIYHHHSRSGLSAQKPEAVGRELSCSPGIIRPLVLRNVIRIVLNDM